MMSSCFRSGIVYAINLMISFSVEMHTQIVIFLKFDFVYIKVEFLNIAYWGKKAFTCTKLDIFTNKNNQVFGIPKNTLSQIKSLFPIIP